MSNTILTHSMIAQRALFDFKNNLSFSGPVYKGYNSEFKAVGRFEKGNSVTVALPQQFRAKDGSTLDTVDVKENSTTVSVDTQKHVGLNFTEDDYTFKVEDFSRKYLVPATIALANKVDTDGLAEYVNIYNSVGTPGDTPATYGVITDAALMMDNEAVPRDRRQACLSPKAHWKMKDGELKGVFEQPTVRELVRTANFGYYGGFDFMYDQNVQTHTVGTIGSDSPEMNGSTSEGASSLVTDGWTASTAVLKQGDVLTIQDVYANNPVSGSAWEGNTLRQFVVTADVTSGAGGDATIPISPTIYSNAAAETNLPYQTVVTLPANNADITVLGDTITGYPQNIFYHPDAFALTVLPFTKPMSAGKSVLWETASDPDLGLALTLSQGFDITNYNENTRLDVLYGWDTIRPSLAVRVWG